LQAADGRQASAPYSLLIAGHARQLEDNLESGVGDGHNDSKPLEEDKSR